MNTSTISTGMRRETGEGSTDVLSEDFADPSRNRISVEEKGAAHSEGEHHTRNQPVDADSGSLTPSWPSCSPRERATARTLQGKVSVERAIPETEMER